VAAACQPFDLLIERGTAKITGARVLPLSLSS